jgi:hypothetical protein
MPEFSMYRTPDGAVKMRVMRYVLDPPDAGWFRRFFGFPYRLELVGTVDVEPAPKPLMTGGCQHKPDATCGLCAGMC